MSLVMKLMIGGWTTTLLMFGFCALYEAGGLDNLRSRMALWLERSASFVRPSGEGLSLDA